MTTLADLKNDIRSVVARGTTLDSELLRYIRDAVNLIERRHSFGYMLRLKDLTLNIEAPKPQVIKVSDNAVKTIDFVRLVKGNAYHYLKQVAGSDLTSRAGVLPEAYWVVQNIYVVLDCVPTEAFEVEIGWYEKTIVEDSDTFTCWLFDNALEVVRNFALAKIFSLRLRDQRGQFFEQQAQLGFNELLMEDEEKKYSNMDLHI